MQSLVLSHSPLNTGHFGQIGFNPKILSLNLDRPANAEGRSLRDTPSSYFMSSRPTVDDPLKAFKASRQPESAEPRAVTTGSVSEPGVSQTSATAGVHSSQSMLALREPVLPPQDLLIFDRHGAPQSMEPAYVPSTSSLTASPHAAIRALAQRPTRRAKAHVASACVNFDVRRRHTQETRETAAASGGDLYETSRNLSRQHNGIRWVTTGDDNIAKDDSDIIPTKTGA
ncbi:hypothetical protein MPDQ_001384 [Monascus purpureus]|uniref:Uncharacterized protein n=1 Tax=Monascus purpureus TaxID=5098 RepID=A0A507QRZ2_MONPU|nr:hypothetical protein MPDQ_001384 [Monascus purpureus]